jgi:AcrR family transcriptional regulator
MGATLSEPTRQRRRYDSPARRQQAADTRRRIVLAGAELLHGVPTWDWSQLTIRSVAERAGVNERTVYRYFAGERELRDAVMDRLREEAGLDLDGLRLEGVRAYAARMLEWTSTFPLAPRTPRDPTVASRQGRLREALLAAVEQATPDRDPLDRAKAAAVLDVLSAPVSYERLAAEWDLDPADAIDALAWVIDLVEEAITGGRLPERRRPRNDAGRPGTTPARPGA